MTLVFELVLFLYNFISLTPYVMGISKSNFLKAASFLQPNKSKYNGKYKI